VTLRSLPGVDREGLVGRIAFGLALCAAIAAFVYLRVIYDPPTQDSWGDDIKVGDNPWSDLLLALAVGAVGLIPGVVIARAVVAAWPAVARHSQRTDSP